MKAFFTLLFLSIIISTSHAFEETKTQSGHSLFHEKADTAYQYITIVFPYGSAEIPEDKQGSLSLLGKILNLGPKNLSEQEFRRYKFLNNINISFSSTEDNFFAELKFQKGSESKALDLLLKTLKNPKLDEKNFNEKKTSLLTEAAGILDNARSITTHFAHKKMNQGERAYLNGDSTPMTLNNILLNDIVSSHKNINLSEVRVFSFGPVKPSKLKSTLKEFLPKFSKAERNFVKLNDSKNSEAYLLNKKNATDNQILFMKHLGISPYTRDFAKASIIMRVLGGGMSSRLMQALRVKGGLTYGAGSWLQRSKKDQSTWAITTFGGIEQFPKLLAKIPEVLKNFYDQGITEDELSEYRKKVITGHKKRFELPYDLFQTKLVLKLRGYPTDYPDKYLGYVESLRVDDLNSFIKKHFKFEGMTLFAHGDKDKIYKYLPENKTLVEINSIP